MMRLKCRISALLLLCSLSLYSHPLHLTFTGLDYKPLSNRWVLSIKVFSDDFAADVRLATGVEGFSGTQAGVDEADKVLRKWLGQRMQIWFDEKPVGMDGMRFDGISTKADASLVTYSFTVDMPVESIRVRNSLLMNIYPDQKNLFVLTRGKWQSAYEFKIKDQETTIKLNK